MLLIVPDAHAWKAAGHWVLAKQVSRQLPVGNPVRTAMEHQPAMWAWGSFGPDLGYGTSETVSQGWAPWADRYHYRKAGTMAKRMLQSALKSGNEKQIAFAAGWLTHVIGDFTCRAF